MASYVQGNLLLFKFYLKQISTITSLPSWMRNPDVLKANFEKQNGVNPGAPFTLSLPVEVANRYNGEMNSLKVKMRNLHSGEQEKYSYKTQLLFLFLIRFACIASAWKGNVLLTLFLSCLQFIVAPYSLFVSFSLCVALFPPIYAAHYISFNIIRQLAVTILSVVGLDTGLLDWMSLSVNATFIACFFLVDQLYCFYCHYFTPTKEMTFKETLTHMAWGFLNTKTYNVVLLLHLSQAGFRISLWIWFLDAWLQLTNKVATNISRYWMHWLELFYHQHRMAHLPKVYEHAHKLHHYLHGTNAFDAHIYGNGMPEEFFFLVMEITFAIFLGMPPASLNRLILQHSIDNKHGHTQKPEDTHGENFHTDHHLLHVKNYGIYNSLMDMYFSTANFSQKYRLKPSLYHGGQNTVYEIEKTLKDSQVVFTFTPQDVSTKTQYR